MLIPGRNLFGSIRFGPGLFGSYSVWFASVRKLLFPGSTRFGLRFSDASWLGPVRFGSPIPAGSGVKRFCSVRLGRFGSVCLSLPLLWLLLSPASHPRGVHAHVRDRRLCRQRRGPGALSGRHVQPRHRHLQETETEIRIDEEEEAQEQEGREQEREEYKEGEEQDEEEEEKEEEQEQEEERR